MLRSIQPAGLLDQSLLEEGHDHKPAPKREAPGLEEEDEQLAENRSRWSSRRGFGGEGGKKREVRRPTLPAEERPVVRDPDRPRDDE